MKPQKTLEQQVDDILKNKKDVLYLRAKLNVIANARANNNLNKGTEDIERYKTIADYYSKNKDRVSENKKYLVEVMYHLSKYLSNIDASISCKKIKSLLDETTENK